MSLEDLLIYCQPDEGENKLCLCRLYTQLLVSTATTDEMFGQMRNLNKSLPFSFDKCYQ